MPGARPAEAAAGLIAASRRRPPVAITVANGASSAGTLQSLGAEPVRLSSARFLIDRRSRSIGQLGRKTYMTRRIRHLHIP
jgi:hypothetical protein